MCWRHPFTQVEPRDNREEKKRKLGRIDPRVNVRFATLFLILPPLFLLHV